MSKLLLLLVALLVVAGCGDDGKKPERTFTKPADLPTAQQVTKDGSTVPTGAWGVVTLPGTGAAKDVIAVKVTSADRGEAGALKDLRVLNAAGESGLAEAVPYYVSYDYAVLVGSPIGSSPSQRLYAATATGADGLDTLSVPEGVDKCRTPRDVDDYPPDVGYARHGCLTVAAAPGTVPTLIVFDAVSNGSRDVRFQLPAAA